MEEIKYSPEGEIKQKENNLETKKTKIKVSLWIGIPTILLSLLFIITYFWLGWFLFFMHDTFKSVQGPCRYLIRRLPISVVGNGMILYDSPDSIGSLISREKDGIYYLTKALLKNDNETRLIVTLYIGESATIQDTWVGPDLICEIISKDTKAHFTYVEKCSKECIREYLRSQLKILEEGSNTKLTIRILASLKRTLEYFIKKKQKESIEILEKLLKQRKDNQKLEEIEGLIQIFKEDKKK